MNRRKERMAAIETERNELERQAQELANEARGLSAVTQAERRHFLESEALRLREQSYELGNEWSELAEEESRGS
jgi:hypothetical protein